MLSRFAQTIYGIRGLIGKRSAPLSQSASSLCHSEPSCHSEPVEESLPILLAVSGGIDSMCMASLFASLEPSVPFAMAHCNFRLRGAESDGDEEFVRQWAEAHNIVLHRTSFDTEEYAVKHGVSIEMAARELRYGWFARLCMENGYVATAVAHNANDNAETLILNLLRGAGLKGISGMSVISDLPCTDVKGLKVVRPLLGFTRRQIEGYMFFNKVPYREDSTNASSDYKRNLIRNEVFPLFERINPSFVSTLNREMGYFSEAADIVSDWCNASRPSFRPSEASLSFRPSEASLSFRPSEASGGIPLYSLLAEKHWRYLLYHMLEPYGFNSATLSSLEELLVSSRTVSGKRFESHDYILYVERDVLHVVPKVAGQAGNDVMKAGNDAAVCVVRVPGTYHFNGRTIIVELLKRTPDMPFKQPEGTLVFDAERLRFPFVLRKWRLGDWMIPLGMKGKKKVSDIFADLKYDTFKKSSSIILVDTMSETLAARQQVAALLGVRMASLYKVTESTLGLVRITII
ncbi:MAG: tRNA lysidine(34) synthetase TilS [Bacteroidales bacterium]|nr:tRNA lysidine(34) synthetase TilS [Bacteroidales bacterium]